MTTSGLPGLDGTIGDQDPTAAPLIATGATTLSGLSPDTADLGGAVITDLNLDDIGRGVAVQDDGKIVVAGHSWTQTHRDFALVRYDADGSIDLTFSGDGRVTTDFHGYVDVGTSVALQADGKILVAGTSFVRNPYGSEPHYLAFARYEADGSLDPTFSGDGKVVTEFRTDIQLGASVAVQPDGKILVAGSAFDAGGIYIDYDFDFVLARYEADGTLDETFSGDGKVATDIGTRDEVYGLELQPDGRILVVGSTGEGSDRQLAVMRYDSDGTLDSTFSGDGIVTLDLEAYAGIALQTDGRIVLAGTHFNGTLEEFAVVRLDVDGALDTDFAGDGQLTLSVGPDDDQASGVAVQDDGRILVAGSSYNGIDWDFGLVRLETDGSLDTSFAGTGIVTVDLGASERGYGVALQSNGRILVAGARYDGVEEDFTLVRFGADGTLDASFSSNYAPTGVLAVVGTPIQGRILSASNTLADVDGLGSITFQWNADGIAIDGATGSTYTPTAADVGKTISVTASYTDGQGRFESVTSEATPAIATAVIQGTAGNDTLVGSDGRDTMAGGQGNDTYHVNATGDQIVERVGEGTDTVWSSLSSYRLDSFVENGRIVSTGVASLSGNGLSNLIHAGKGDNVLDGGAGTDTLSYASGTVGGTGVRVSLATIGAQVTGGSGIDTIAGFERLIGSANDDSLTGNGGANLLRGDRGRDTVIGAGGNDTIHGDAGNDLLRGGAGNDLLRGGAGNDTVSGGAGSDIFRFDAALGTGTTPNIDRIIDFVPADDTIQLENAVFKSFGTKTGAIGTGQFRASLDGKAADRDDYLLYEIETGKLFYDADGSGPGIAVQFAVIGQDLVLTSADFVLI